MKTLLEFLKMRHTMPQIVDHDAFMADLKQDSITVTQSSRPAKELKPTQKNFNQEKVDDMKESGDWSKKPIVISSDDKIIDGHHRWLAAKQLKKDIDVCIIDLPVRGLLEFLKGKPYIEKKGVKE